MGKHQKIILVGVSVALLCLGGCWIQHKREARRLALLKSHKNLDGLVGWWPGDGDAVDIVSGERAILENGAGFASGVSGQAFDLVPNPRPTSNWGRVTAFCAEIWNQALIRLHLRKAGFLRYKHMRVADRPAFRLTNAMTLSAWINPKLHFGYQEVIGKWSAVYPVANYQESFTFAFASDGRIYGGVSPLANGTGSESVYGTSQLPLGTWTHVALTYDGSAMRIYVNGRLEGTQPYTNGIYPGTYDVGIGAVVGDAAQGQCFSPFHGKIADACIYNRALSSEEIEADYTARKK